MEDLFIQFLKDEGIHDAYFANLNNPDTNGMGISLREMLGGDISPFELITSAFIWGVTPEEENELFFWEEKDNKWNKLLKEQK